MDKPYINRSVLIFSFLNPFGGNNARIVDSKIAHNGFALGIAQWRGGLNCIDTKHGTLLAHASVRRANHRAIVVH